MLWEVYEMHCITGHHNKFYRIMHSGNTVVVRSGRRGTEGRVSVKKIGSIPTSDDVFVADQRANKYREGYETVYSDDARGDATVPVPLPSRLPKSIEEIEQLCLDRWRLYATYEVPDTPTRWVLYSGLVETSKVNLTARFMLEALQSRTHAIDVGRDLVIGSRAYNPYVNLATPADLGPVGLNDSEEVLAAALSLWFPESSNPSAFMDAARRHIGASRSLTVV
jgi:predicted DNA-binding WGR domain protein